MNSVLRLFAVVSLLLPAFAAVATPANKASLEKHFGRFLSESAQRCVLCHVSEHGADASSLDEFPHNPFGDALRVVGEQLVEGGKDDAISERLKSIADLDSDGDGQSNLIEILLGAMPGDAEDVPSAAALEQTGVLLAEYQQYASRYRWRPFKSVQRPVVPQIDDAWPRNPIDAFVANQHQQRGLSPRGEARPEQLLRRVYLDLIGLSPSPEEIQQFTAEYALDPNAYERAVDVLLEHPGYGQRWGRHWMDIWRYSDWAGYKNALRESQRHIWHWRDWIVDSLNCDKGYDEMLAQMLAADEMNLADDGDLRATGYLARNFFNNRDQWMDNVVKHTSQAFMGVTIGCTKCHDHMYDPFPQADYYAMRAVFEPHNVRTDRVPGELDRGKNGIPRAYDRTVAAKTFLFERGDERRPMKDEPIPPSPPKTLGGRFDIVPVSLSRDASHPDQREFVINDLRLAARQKIDSAKADDERLAAEKAYQVLIAELELESREADGLSDKSDDWKAAAKQLVTLQRDAEKLAAEWALSEAKQKQTSAAASLKKAEAAKDSAAIAKAKRAKSVADKAMTTTTQRMQKATQALEAEITTKFKRREQATYPNQSSGRRLAFANWLTHRENPLTARVAMNHIWLRHFGRAIVPTVNDFGAAGGQPTHPALLDWLAAELMARDWSMKHMHRLIVTSATYRMASTGDESNRAIDPDNEYLWRHQWRRMEGEIVRDNLLHIAGRLDGSLGGPDIDNKLAQSSRRRSIYLRHAHEKLVEFVQIFDGPAVSECYTRESSVQPHQALALANSRLAVDSAASIAAQLAASTTSHDEFIEQAFLHVLSRLPKDEELKLCLPFLDDDSRSRHNLVLVLINHNDFVTIR